MKKIRLMYWNGDNYGDVLSPALIHELSGVTVQHCDNSFSVGRTLTVIIKDILTLSTKRTRQVLFPWQDSMLGIGSVITWGVKRSKVWGAGFMNESEEFKGGEIFAVRGPKTAKKLVEAGYESVEVLGDPALLLPLWIKPVKEKLYDLSIIPHWTEVDYFKEKYGKQYNIIDLRSRDIIGVTNQITASKYVLSTSLHGIIVSHAYNIPALWIKKGYIHTDGFKFDDYFSSVGIPFYNGFENLDEILASTETWKHLFIKNIDKCLIKKSLEHIQFGLLQVAPFKLKKKYEDVAAKLDRM